MTRQGRIPDDVAQQIESNRSFTHGNCDECYKEVKFKVDHPYKDDVYICSECEADILMNQEGLDPNEFDDQL